MFGTGLSMSGVNFAVVPDSEVEVEVETPPFETGSDSKGRHSLDSCGRRASKLLTRVWRWLFEGVWRAIRTV